MIQYDKCFKSDEPPLDEGIHIRENESTNRGSSQSSYLCYENVFPVDQRSHYDFFLNFMILPHGLDMSLSSACPRQLFGTKGLEPLDFSAAV